MKIKREDGCLDPSLVLYLPLHQLDGETFVSKDGTGHRCAADGSPWTPRGRTFDGLSQKIVIPDAGYLRFTGEFSICFWGWHPADVSSDRSFLSKYISLTGTSNYEIYFDGAITNRIQARWTHDYAGSALWRVCVCTTLILPQIWYHIVFTHSKGTFKFFVNGAASGSSTLPGEVLDTPAADIWLGIRNNNGSRLECTIGEVSIYNRALTAQEVLQNYLETKWRYR